MLKSKCALRWHVCWMAKTMSAEKFMREVIRLWMQEQGMQGTVRITKESAANGTGTSADGKEM